jgi:hypothetical protein
MGRKCRSEHPSDAVIIKLKLDNDREDIPARMRKEKAKRREES